MDEIQTSLQVLPLVPRLVHDDLHEPSELFFLGDESLRGVSEGMRDPGVEGFLFLFVGVVVVSEQFGNQEPLGCHPGLCQERRLVAPHELVMVRLCGGEREELKELPGESLSVQDRAAGSRFVLSPSATG